MVSFFVAAVYSYGRAILFNGHVNIIHHAAIETIRDAPNRCTYN